MRAFIAVDVPPTAEMLRFMEAVKKAGRVKLVERENLHLTVKFLGEVSEDLANAIVRTLRDRVREHGPFEVVFRGYGFFPPRRAPRVVWIGVESEGFIRLAKDVDAVLSNMGFEKERDYVPHLTVARVKGRFDRGAIPEEFSSMFFGRMTVEHVKLKKSTLTPKGPVYTDVAVLSLR